MILVDVYVSNTAGHINDALIRSVENTVFKAAHACVEAPKGGTPLQPSEAACQLEELLSPSWTIRRHDSTMHVTDEKTSIVVRVHFRKGE